MNNSHDIGIAESCRPFAQVAISARALAMASALAASGWAQSDWTIYGCGVNPSGSLTVSGGSASLGDTLSVGIDNPLGTQPSGSLALLAISAEPAIGFPCGVPIPGLGMVGPYGAGELLVSFVAPNPLLWLGPVTWTGAGTPAVLDVAIPSSVAFAELEFFFQAVLIDPNAGAAVSEAAAVALNRCAGLGQTEQDNPVGQSPWELVADDFDADGVVDIVVANSGGGDVSYLAGLGDGTFAAQVEFPTGGDPMSLTSGDFNGDGALDLAIGDDGLYEIALLFGAGDGTFGPRIGFSVPDMPRSIESADLDADGDLDLVIAHEQGDILTLWANDGSGTFASMAVLSVGEEPLGIKVADINGDAILDLLSANNDTNDVSILLGIGAGAFASEARFAVGSRPHDVEVVDLDGDGVLDLLTPNYLGDTISVALGTLPGSFATPLEHPVPDGPNELAVVDVDSDGALDLVVAHDTNLDLASVSFGRGDGSLSDAQQLPAAGDVPHHVVRGDFDNNGSIDVAFSNLQFAARRVRVLLNACP